MNSVLLVVASDHLRFEQWTRQWGIRLKNTQIMSVESEKEAIGFVKKETFYTVLDGLQNSIVDALEKKGYTYVEQEKIEKALEKVSIRRYPTQ